MDTIPNSTIWKDQTCEIEASKVNLIQLHDKHTTLNKPIALQASKDDGEKSVDIICYGATFSPYKSDLQREFSEDNQKFETQTKRSKRLSGWKWSEFINLDDSNDNNKENELEDTADSKTNKKT
ncbi:hypothetical protein Hanom_Chr04g00336961 [Helianthus anomalus]